MHEDWAVWWYESGELQVAGRHGSGIGCVSKLGPFRGLKPIENRRTGERRKGIERERMEG
jgi:hypothetical protein